MGLKQIKTAKEKISEFEAISVETKMKHRENKKSKKMESASVSELSGMRTELRHFKTQKMFASH